MFHRASILALVWGSNGVPVTRKKTSKIHLGLRMAFLGSKSSFTEIVISWRKKKGLILNINYRMRDGCYEKDNSYVVTISSSADA